MSLPGRPMRAMTCVCSLCLGEHLAHCRQPYDADTIFHPFYKAGKWKLSIRQIASNGGPVARLNLSSQPRFAATVSVLYQYPRSKDTLNNYYVPGSVLSATERTGQCRRVQRSWRGRHPWLNLLLPQLSPAFTSGADVSHAPRCGLGAQPKPPLHGASRPV